jgi:biotin carboxyl carrier protein
MGGRLGRATTIFALVAVAGLLFAGGGVLVFGEVVLPGGGPSPASDHRLDPGEKPPRFVEHNFMDLDHVDRISKFRGAYGHDYSSSDEETCRSMKHYLVFDSRNNRTMSAETMYYAPVDGTVVAVRYDDRDPADARVQVVSSEYPSVLFRYHHIDPNVTEGQRVDAGQPIGHVTLTHSGGEIAVAQYWNGTSQQVSFFKIASDEVFQQYRERGVESRSQLVFSEQHRDDNPLVCPDDSDHYFAGRKDVDESTESFHEWVSETQFVDLEE